MADADQTIIIKKIKKGGHGHHGGAWKVAYADFVTAMMAFFLLMWLLNATEAENLAGLADYFAPTVGIQGEMGIGFRGGKGALSKGIGADKNTNRGIIFGGMPTGPIMKVTESFELVTEEADAEKIKIIIGGSEDTDIEDSAEFSDMAEAVEAYINEITEEEVLENPVSVTVTPEGLEIQINDSQNASMFETGTDKLQQRIKKALGQLAGVVMHMPNYISIAGHTSSIPIAGKINYSNWELSADRANSTRRFLVASGIELEQIARVIGKADNSPFDPRHPELPVNNRITITLLRNSVLPSHKQAAPDAVFLDPESKAAKTLTQEVVEDDLVAPKYSKDESVEEAINEIESADDSDVVSEENLGLPDVEHFIPDTVLFEDGDASKPVLTTEESDSLNKEMKELFKFEDADKAIEGGTEEGGGYINGGDALNEGSLGVPDIERFIPNSILFDGSDVPAKVVSPDGDTGGVDKEIKELFKFENEGKE